MINRWMIECKKRLRIGEIGFVERDIPKAKEDVLERAKALTGGTGISISPGRMARSRHNQDSVCNEAVSFCKSSLASFAFLVISEASGVSIS